MVSLHPRRTFALSLVLCAVLVPLLQIGLGYLSFWAASPWFWLAGTPIAYLLIGGLGAFCVTGGLPASLARGRGAQLAVIGCLLGGFIAALMVAAIVINTIHTAQTQPPQPSRGIPGLGFIIIIFVFVPAFLVVNLLGVALAPLGGLAGGSLKATMLQGVQSALAPVGQQEPTSRTWIVAIIIAVGLAILIGVAGLWLTTGAFSAVN
jgi:hypothetical protein